MDIVDLWTCQENQLIFINGWIHRIIKDNKSIFLMVRDGQEKARNAIQVVLNKHLISNSVINISKLRKETCVEITGHIRHNTIAQGGLEILCTRIKIIGEAEPLEKIEDKNRHLILREDRLTMVLKLQHFVKKYVREFFDGNRFYEVTPPTITQQSPEGNDDIFKFDYFEERVSLTQSSQLYLETMLPAMKRVYSILPSYRAEKNYTRRHLCEFTHIEAEMAFIDFNQLIIFIEKFICFVTTKLMENEESKNYILKLNPEFKPFTEPFVRMKYSDAIKFLNKNEIHYKNNNTYKLFTYGMDIEDKYERKILDIVKKPVFITHFPISMKSFYADGNSKETLSVDLLLPNVGEVLSGSMRIWNKDELIKRMEQQNMNVKYYQMYIDQRKYGSCPHGGFGIGLERLLLSITNLDSIKDCCPYPRSHDQHLV